MCAAELQRPYHCRDVHRDWRGGRSKGGGILIYGGGGPVRGREGGGGREELRPNFTTHSTTK